MLYMLTFTINIPQMLAYIPYMDPMGNMNVHEKSHQSQALRAEDRNVEAASFFAALGPLRVKQFFWIFLAPLKEPSW